MPIFEIEQYETHIQRYRVTAKSKAKAIKKLFDGEADVIDSSQELVEVCDVLGLRADEHQDLAKELRSLGIKFDDVIPSIRSVEEVE